MPFEMPDVDDLVKEALKKSVMLYQEGRFVEAEIVLNQLVKVDPENLDALELIGLVKHGQKQYEEAAEYFQNVIDKDPERSESHNNISLCFSCLGKVEESIEHAKRAIEIDPEKHYYYTNLAIQYKQADQNELSLETFARGMEIKPDDAGAWANLGSTYGHMKQLDKAIECYDKAVSYDPSLDSAYVDRGYAKCLCGKFSEGWEDLNHRMAYFPPVESFKKTYNWDKLWDGEQSLVGKTIVIWCEQGVGDLIQFSRFLPELKKEGCRILLHTPDPLLSLFRANDFADEIEETFADADYDYHCSIMNLPWLLNIPDRNLVPRGLLKINKDADLDQYSDVFKIGITWAGNPRHPSDQKRSTKLANFQDIHAIPGVKLFNLQKDLRARAYSNAPEPVDLAEGCDNMNIIDTSPFLEDFEDTAAIISKMDMMITVDTVILHIAASLGVPTLGLLHFNPDWRWTIEGEDTIWYPNVKLLRQPTKGDWEAPFKRATEIVQALVEGKAMFTKDICCTCND